MPPSNLAAYLAGSRVKPLSVSSAPYTLPDATQLVIKAAAVAINPVDWIKQLAGDLLLGYLRYPFVPGNDVSGTVVEVGSSVTRFRVGDRVAGLAVGTAPFANRSAEGAFQKYVVLREYLAAPIPEGMGHERACVVPLGLATAAYGLFHKEFLGLDFPSVPREKGNEGKAIIITGGASSVGCNAIQLAVSAGYTVYTTASPRNHAYLRKLGASGVFDYHSRTIVEDILHALEGQQLVGAYALGSTEAVEMCSQILRRHKKTSHKFVALAGTQVTPEQLGSKASRAVMMLAMLWMFFRNAVMAYFTGVQIRWIDSKDLHETEGVAGRIFRDFLPEALRNGQFVPAPEPMVTGKGLERVQEAMDIQMKGVSCRKIVVELE